MNAEFVVIFYIFLTLGSFIQLHQCYLYPSEHCYHY